jgi:hypothetical protein
MALANKFIVSRTVSKVIMLDVRIAEWLCAQELSVISKMITNLNIFVLTCIETAFVRYRFETYPPEVDLAVNIMEYREFTDSDGFKYRRKVPI